jgi:hypothetical protein
MLNISWSVVAAAAEKVSMPVAAVAAVSCSAIWQLLTAWSMLPLVLAV